MCCCFHNFGVASWTCLQACHHAYTHVHTQTYKLICHPSPEATTLWAEDKLKLPLTTPAVCGERAPQVSWEVV